MERGMHSSCFCRGQPFGKRRFGMAGALHMQEEAALHVKSVQVSGATLGSLLEPGTKTTFSSCQPTVAI